MSIKQDEIAAQRARLKELKDLFDLIKELNESTPLPAAATHSSSALGCELHLTAVVLG